MADMTDSYAAVYEAERQADALARRGASAAEIDAADDETERRHQQCKADRADWERGR